MNRRETLIEAHRVAAAVIRQYVDTADEPSPGNVDDERMCAALVELAVRHERAVERMTE